MSVQPSQQETEKLQFDILKVIKEQQSRHGIREGSHLRYREYCTRRLHSVRKTLNLTQVSIG